jgi:hypothetical protein
METVIYWKGRPVGVETADGHINWFSNMSREAVEALTHPSKKLLRRK